MLGKILSLFILPIALIISLFSPTVSMPEEPGIVVENEPETDKKNTFDKIDGVNGSVFYIVRPQASKYTEVSSNQFGMSPAKDDNTSSFIEALNYAKLHPFTKLKIEEGIYYFRNTNMINFNNIKDFMVDGSKARFVFTVPGTNMAISNSDNIEINGLTIDWDRENSSIEDIVKMVRVDKESHTYDLEFVNRENIDENMKISALTRCDENDFTFGSRDSYRENYYNGQGESVVKQEKISDNVLRLTSSGVTFDNAEIGEMYILRHYVYDGQVFYLYNNAKNITLDNLKIYGNSGCGIIVHGGVSHFQVLNSYIGIEPKYKDKYFVSLGADAIHIANSGGFFRVENCDISRQGDDALNVHDGLAYIDSVNTNTINVYASNFRSEIGDILKFKNDKFVDLDYSAKIVGVMDYGSTKTITFDKDVSSVLKAGYIGYSTAVCSENYVIRNNYIHENRARGFLLQSSNGLCENNTFYKTQTEAIKVILDIIPSLWQEGTGVDNLVIRNNTFKNCNYYRPVIMIGSSINGKIAECEPFTNISIVDNTFIDDNVVITAYNTNNLKIENNTFKVDCNESIIQLLDYTYNSFVKNNKWESNYSLLKQLCKAESFWKTVLINIFDKC